MNINLSQLISYTTDEARLREKIAKLQSDLDYARLQAKQTRECRARAIKSPHVKALVAAFCPSDDVEIMPAPGSAYVTFIAKGVLKLANMQVSGDLGWAEYRTEPDAPVTPRQTHHHYRHPDAPGIVLIVTEVHL